MAHRTSDFQTIRSEGGLLPSDLLRRVLDPRANLDGARPEDYGLPQNERLNEVITQSWNRLRRHWAEFRAAADLLPAGEPGTGLTNDRWSLPLLRELGFGPLPTSAGPEINGRTYAISRFVGPVPVHLVGCGLSLDRRAAGVRGAAAANPHGLVQEFVNRSPGHLWAIVANGLRLRVLRDNQALSRQSFLEFDLEAMFAGEVYADFVLLWLMVHATRFQPQTAKRPDTCWLEQWSQLAAVQGTRALGDLRGGVERALQILGEGLTSHQKNTALRDALRTGQVSLVDFHGQLLRVVYRLIFLFVAEDRTLDGQPLLHPRDDAEAARTARTRFAAHYGTARLRDMAAQIKGSRHGDLWCQFQLLVGALSGDAAWAAAREHLALPALGSFLWSRASTASLNDAELTNYDFLEALRDLAFTRQGKVLRPVDYRDLGAEELGGVYESLLALTPQISADGARFTFAEFAGNERKTSGSYYTPDALVQCLLDSALDPVVEEAITGKTSAEAEQAILALKVCDPAVGSGHFLVGAAHRLARHLARVRALAQGESEPSPLLYQHALRDVIGRCLYGVDANPMSAELCRVSLWLEALEPGKPLAFLDHHIRVGNSLLGATPTLIAGGLPDDAFTAIEGDDKKACAVLKKRNKAERRGLGPLFAAQDAETQARLQQSAAALEALPDDRPEDIRAKELAFRRHEQTEDYRHKKQLADAWCAAFVIRKHFREPGREASASGLTQGHLNDLAGGGVLPAEFAAEVERLSGQYQFFHWHLAFPEVFAEGGFDCVLGNPPWEHAELEETEWFAEYRPDIARAPNDAAKKKLIEELRMQDGALYQAFSEVKRAYAAFAHFASHSDRFPLCGRGRMNTASLFSELCRHLRNSKGSAGIVVPTGIATDDTTKDFFADILSSQQLISLLGFHNGKALFPAVRPHQQFCLMTIGPNPAGTTEFAFSLSDIGDLNSPGRRFLMTKEDIDLVNPNTGTCPIFSSRSQMELTRIIYLRVPVLFREKADNPGPWGVTFKQGLFNMATDSKLFRTRQQLTADEWIESGRVFQKSGAQYVPLFDAKMAQQYNHRAAELELSGHQFRKIGKDQSTLAQLEDPNYTPRAIYFVPQDEVRAKLLGWSRDWLLGFKDVTGVTSMFLASFSVIPRQGVGHPYPLLFSNQSPVGHAILLAVLNSLIIEFVLRQKLQGLHLTFYYVKQLPVPSPTTFADPCTWSRGEERLQDWLLPRVLELTYTAWDLEPFAQDCGWSGPPFRWDEERRFLLRCELDAAFFHLYLPAEANGNWRPADGETAADLVQLKASFPTPRAAVAYIMDTFPIVRRKDEAQFNGDYRTKRVILDIYDALAEVIRTGQPYQTRLDPPPADPRCCHPPRAALPQHGHDGAAGTGAQQPVALQSVS